MIPIPMLLCRAASLRHPLLQVSQVWGSNILERQFGNRSSRNVAQTFYPFICFMYVTHVFAPLFGITKGIFWLLPNSPTAAYLQSQSAGHEQLISRLHGTAFIASRFPSLPSQAAISYPYSSWAKLFCYEIAQPGIGLFLPSRQPCKKDLGQPLLRGPASEKSSAAKHRAWGARGLLGKEVPIGDATKQGEPASTRSDAQMGLRAEEEEEDLGLAAAGDTCTRDRMGTVQLRKEWEEARKTWVPCCTSTALAQH